MIVDDDFYWVFNFVVESNCCVFGQVYQCCDMYVVVIQYDLYVDWNVYDEIEIGVQGVVGCVVYCG